MKDQNQIPVSKVARATRFAATGIKLGGNYVKHYAKKMTNQRTDDSELHAENAEDVYGLLSQLKGGALKVAQMLSMDRNMLPEAYNKKFELSQYSAPPLSGPLIQKTFQKYIGKSPGELFDRFDSEASNAASIGQVHKAEKNGKNLAIKIQYPGVKDSLKTDLMMARPVAARLMNMRAAELDKYIQEVEERLIEETDYQLELERSMDLSRKLENLPNIVFPTYYPELSGDRVLSMDWIDGIHLSEYVATNPSQEDRDYFGQIIWDFYNYQIHELKEVHADPHPGNFLVTPDRKLAVLDFGCVKQIPDSFYTPYTDLMDTTILEDRDQFISTLYELDLLRKSDTDNDKALLLDSFTRMVSVIARPMSSEEFDFSDSVFFESIYSLGEEVSGNSRLRKMSGRGNKHAIYVNRTYFGLFNLLHVIGARVKTRNYWSPNT